MHVLQYKAGSGTITYEDRAMILQTGGLWVGSSWQDIVDNKGSRQVVPANINLSASGNGLYTNNKGTTIIRAGGDLRVNNSSDLTGVWTSVAASTYGFANALTHPQWVDNLEKWLWVGKQDGTNAVLILSSDDAITWTQVYVGTPGGFTMPDISRISSDGTTLAWTGYTHGNPSNPIFYTSDGGLTVNVTGQLFTWVTSLGRRQETMFYENNIWFSTGGYERVSRSLTLTSGWGLVVQNSASQFDNTEQVTYGNGEWLVTSGVDILASANGTSFGNRALGVGNASPFSLAYDAANDVWIHAAGGTVRLSSNNFTSHTSDGTWGLLQGGLITKVQV